MRIVLLIAAAGLAGGVALAACGASEDALAEPARIVFATSRDHDGPLRELETVNAELYTMAVDGTGLQRITDDPAVDVYPRMSPGGDEIAFLSNRAGRGESFDLYVIRTDGAEVRRLTTGGGVQSAAWSPDGSTLAYTLERGGSSSVRLIGRNGAGDRRLVAGSWPSWSPDGRRILFTVGEFLREPQSLAVVDVAGGDPVPVSLGLDNASEAAWSPDGERIAFMHNPAGYEGSSNEWDEEIYVANVDGSRLARVSKRAGNDHWPPSWSSDGRCLVWQGDAPDGRLNAEIYAAALDTADLRTRAVTATEAFELLPAWTPGSCPL